MKYLGKITDSKDLVTKEYVDNSIPTKTSDLVNDSNFMSGMTILAYGKNTWADFITAYTAKQIVYCRASSASNPASGSQTRLAFLAYVNNAESPTEVEFQYYRSVSSHNITQQGDQVYVYKLTSSGTWSVTVRENYTRIVAGTNMTSSYSSGVLTLNNSGGGAVDSVNGQTGVIVLDADDVGAIAAPSSPAVGDALVWDGTDWVAQAVSPGGGGNDLGLSVVNGLLCVTYDGDENSTIIHNGTVSIWNGGTY